jgi:hypothetical protein
MIEIVQRIALLIGTFLLAACAQQYEPVIDTNGVDMARYRQDLGSCRRVHEQVDKTADALSNLSGGALDPMRSVLDEKTVVDTCLGGHGYTVLR